MARLGTQPPYTTAADIASFFERIGNKQPPAKLDREWVESYNIAANQPSAITALVKWLGIVNDDGSAKAEIWNKLRQPASRAEAIALLVREAYSAVFDRISVEDASRDDLDGAFIDAYAVGDADKKVKCFLTLCELAEIKVAAAGERSAAANGSGSASAAKKSIARETKKQTAPKSQTPKNEPPPASSSSGMTIVLNVEVPADWTEAEIRERIKVVSRAVRETGVEQA